MKSMSSPSLSPCRPKDPLFSFVIPAYAEAENIENFLTSLEAYLKTLSIRYELILIDDGSPDNTAQLIREKGKTLPLTLLQFSRNFGKEQALTAGLAHASGEAAILLDSDSQHPLPLIKRFIAHWNEGYEMVYGVQETRQDEGWLKRSLTPLFYKVLNWMSNVPVEPNAGDFRLLDRKIIDALNRLPERTRFMKGLYAWVGLKSLGIPFRAEKRPAGKSSYTLRKLSSLAALGLTSFSTLPLRISMLIGLLASCLSLSYGFWIVLRTLFWGADLPGWSTLVAGILFLGGIQLIAIGILGEYIAHIFTEVKQRPHYIISEIYTTSTPSPPVT